MNQELSELGIKSTALCPGFVDTPMTDFVKGQVPPEAMIQTSDIVASVRMLLALTPGLRRAGDRLPAARLAAPLTSSAVSSRPRRRRSRTPRAGPRRRRLLAEVLRQHERLLEEPVQTEVVGLAAAAAARGLLVLVDRLAEVEVPAGDAQAALARGAAPPARRRRSCSAAPRPARAARLDGRLVLGDRVGEHVRAAG